MDVPLISSPVGVLTVLCGIGAFFFLLEQRTSNSGPNGSFSIISRH
jgi:hypothetical protein